MWEINPFKNWYKPSAYSAWYWYPILMPLMAIILLPAVIDNIVYSIYRKIKRR